MKLTKSQIDAITSEVIDQLQSKQAVAKEEFKKEKLKDPKIKKAVNDINKAATLLENVGTDFSLAYYFSNIKEFYLDKFWTAIIKKEKPQLESWLLGKENQIKSSIILHSIEDVNVEQLVTAVIKKFTSDF